MYVQCMYNVCTWYNQLSQQVFMVDREMQMQDRGTSLCPLLHGTIWMQAVPVQKMEIFLMPGQMLKIQSINKFLEGLESQEEAGFDRLHSLLSKLPVPVAAHGSNMSHAEALEGGFLPRNSRSGLRLLSSYCTGTQ